MPIPKKNCHMHFKFLVEIVSGNQMTIFDFYELRGGGFPLVRRVDLKIEVFKCNFHNFIEKPDGVIFVALL